MSPNTTEPVELQHPLPTVSVCQEHCARTLMFPKPQKASLLSQQGMRLQRPFTIMALTLVIRPPPGSLPRPHPHMRENMQRRPLSKGRQPCKCLPSIAEPQGPQVVPAPPKLIVSPGPMGQVAPP